MTENTMRTIKITAGMTPEFEMIRTNAPDELIDNQLKLNSEIEENGESIINPYSLFENNGYIVELLGCQDNDELTDMKSDKQFDYYDYL